MAARDEREMWLLNCLNAILDPSLGAMNAAEDALSKASLQPGYGVALIEVALNSEFSVGLRQLAAVLLKRYVKQHWVEGEKDYVPPIVPSEDKEKIRSRLLLALGDPQMKIQTAIGVAIGCIAISDWPDEWPDLMQFVLGCISDKSDINKVNGGMRCLSLFASDVDDKQLPHLVPVLFPALYDIVSSPAAYSSSTRRQALVVLHSCIATLGVMSGTYQSETKLLLSPMLKAWMQQFALILSSPVLSEDPEDWGLKAETLKALLQTVQHFPKLAFHDFSVVVGALWQTFVSGYHVYDTAAIKGIHDTYPDLVDADGTDQSLEAFAIQLFEFVGTLVGLPRYRKVVSKSIKDVAYYTIGYLQMTEEQVQTWSSNPNEFLAEEDCFTCNCRSSGISLLEELVTSGGKEGVLCILEAVGKRIEEAANLKAQGETGWWKLCEAAFLALGSCIDLRGDMFGIKIDDFVNRILVENMSEDVKLCPFLYGRALWAAAKFSEVIFKDNREKFFIAAVEGLSENSNVPVMIGSCQALSELLLKVEAKIYEPRLGSVFSTLGTLLQEASDDTLHITLETLRSAIRTDGKRATEVEAMLSPLLLNVWAKFVSDPLISVDALDTLEAVMKLPGCVEPMATRIIPSIAGILSQYQNQAPGLVAGAMELLTMLLQNASMEVTKNAYNAVFSSIIDIITYTDDHSEIQNGTQVLAGFVRNGGENLLVWATDANIAMKMLLDAAARLLNPETDSSAALFSGLFIVQLIEKLSSHMFPYLRDLTAALVKRLESVALKGSLIFVFAKLVHMSAPNFGQFIELLVNTPSANYGNGLICVMSEWTKYHYDIQGAYQIKVSTTALASLLASGHSMLSQITVQGRLIESSGGIKTRSRARVQPDQWTSVSLPQKIFSILADALSEAPDFAEDSDGDWEETSDAGESIEEAAVKPLNPCFQPLEHYEHLYNTLDDDDTGDEDIDDPFKPNDPLNKLNLRAYLVDFVKRFSTEAPATFAELFKELSEPEKTAVRNAILSETSTNHQE